MHGDISDIVAKYIIVRLCALFDKARIGGHDNLSVNGLKRLLSDKAWELVVNQLGRFEEAVKAVERLQDIRHKFLAHNDYASRERNVSIGVQEIGDAHKCLQCVQEFLDGLIPLKGVIEVEIDECTMEAPAEWNGYLVRIAANGEVNITLPDEESWTVIPSRFNSPA